MGWLLHGAGVGGGGCHGAFPVGGYYGMDSPLWTIMGWMCPAPQGGAAQEGCGGTWLGGHSLGAGT